MSSSPVLSWDAVSLSLQDLVRVSIWLIQMPCLCPRTSPCVPTQWPEVWSWADCPSDFTVSPRLSLLQPHNRKKIIYEGPGLEIISNSFSPGMRVLGLLVTLCVVSPSWPWEQEGVLGHCCDGHCSHINWHNFYALLLKSPYTHCSALISIVLYSWCHPYMTGQSPYTLPRVPAPASTGCVFPSCP